MGIVNEKVYSNDKNDTFIPLQIIHKINQLSIVSNGKVTNVAPTPQQAPITKFFPIWGAVQLSN